jgi:quercetin dioxygenase-like cupin family protein
VIDSPKLVDTPRRLVAAVRLTIPKDQIQNEMGPAIAEAMSVVAEQGLAVVGPWFCAHDRMDPNEWDFDVCVEVASPVAPQGRVKPGVLESTRVVQTNYRGPYEGLGDGWGAFESWIAANGFAGAPNLFERYCVGPESGGESSTFVTELNRPLAKVSVAEFSSRLSRDGFTSMMVEYPAGTTFDEHAHEFDSRLLVTDGEFSITIDGVALSFTVGDVFVLPANTVHSEVVGPNGVRYLSGRLAAATTVVAEN